LYSLHPDARAELEDAARWYETQVEGLGEQFLHVVEQTLELIAGRPSIGPSWTSPRFEESASVRRAVLARFPYVVVYSIEDAGVVVWSIAHSRRKPGYWAGRVRT